MPKQLNGSKKTKDDQIHRFATIFGLDEDKLRNILMMLIHVWQAEQDSASAEVILQISMCLSL